MTEAEAAARTHSLHMKISATLCDSDLKRVAEFIRAAWLEGAASVLVSSSNHDTWTMVETTKEGDPGKSWVYG